MQARVATADTTGDALATVPIDARLIGEAQTGAWVRPDGTCFLAPRWRHDRIAKLLRNAGDGPKRDWYPGADWWAVLQHDGGLRIGVRVTPAQWRALEAVLAAAPDGGYREMLRAAIRTARDLSAHVVNTPELPPSIHVAARLAERRHCGVVGD